MNQDKRQRRAQTVNRAGIGGERGVGVQEGTASSGATNFDNTTGDLIPGASLLVSRARRIVLVTDQNAYVLKGRRLDRPGARLGTYSLGSQCPERGSTTAAITGA